MNLVHPTDYTDYQAYLETLTQEEIEAEIGKPETWVTIITDEEIPF